MNKEIGTRLLRLLNSLPRSAKDSENLKVFKKRLKTYLFSECYDRDNYRHTCLTTKHKWDGLEQHRKVATGPKTTSTGTGTDVCNYLESQ